MKLPYLEQLELKRNHLLELLKLNELNNLEILPPIASTPQLGSRARSKMVVNRENRELSVGILDGDMLGIDISTCPLHEPELKDLILKTKVELIKSQIEPYDIKQRRGELKYILARKLSGTDELILRFVVRSDKYKEDLKQLGNTLIKKIPKLKIVTLNIQPVPMAVVEGTQEILLLGPAFTTEQLGQLKFSVSSQSFSQVTPNVALKLYQQVADKVARCNAKNVWDLYCGSGYLSQFSANYFKSCIGVEISAVAIEDARRSAAINNISNVSYIATDSYEFLASKSQASDLVIVNPPRRGLGEKICNELKRLKPKQIIYSSCNPETLVKDLVLLKPLYNVVSMQQFDMFPLTPNYETLTILGHL